MAGGRAGSSAVARGSGRSEKGSSRNGFVLIGRPHGEISLAQNEVELLLWIDRRAVIALSVVVGEEKDFARAGAIGDRLLRHLLAGHPFLVLDLQIVTVVLLVLVAAGEPLRRRNLEQLVDELLVVDDDHVDRYRAVLIRQR